MLKDLYKDLIYKALTEDQNKWQKSFGKLMNVIYEEYISPKYTNNDYVIQFRIKDYSNDISIYINDIFRVTLTYKTLKINKAINEMKKLYIDKDIDSILIDAMIDKDTYTSDEELIERVIQYCNKGKIKEAYELLTDDCKQTYFTHYSCIGKILRE